MSESLYSYMKLGINHHLLNFRCFQDHNYHLETLPFVLNHPSFQVVDLFIVDDDEIREKEIALIKNSGKEIIYNGAFMLPDTKYNPHSLIREEREAILQILKQQADFAMKVKASKFVVVSNLDPGERKRAEAKEGFAEFLYDFAGYISDNSNMKVIIEPGDRDIDKRFLLGPTPEAVEVVKMVRQKGTQNIGLMVDMSHLPLLGESFAQAIRTAGEWLWHIHLGSCVVKDETHPLYGDKHVPLGLKDSENGLDELADFLSELRKCGYLNRDETNSVTLEVRPLPHVTVEETIADQLRVLKKAWERMAANLVAAD